MQRVGAAALVVFGAFMTYHAWRLGLGESGAPGPGFAPFIAGLAVTILAALQVAIGRLPVVTDLRLPAAWREMLLLVASLFAYVLVVERLGFGPTTFVWLAMLFALMEPRRWWAAVLGSAVTVLIAHLLFVVAFRLQLPRGPLGF